MADLNDPNLKIDDQALPSSSLFSFADFPEDVQLCILSFLTPSEISSFSCTSKRFATLCRSDSKVWFSMCDRRWGSKTLINKWGSGKIGFKHLYKTLNRWENLIGFWRRKGRRNDDVLTPPLFFFEWGSSSIIGFRVSPSKTCTYQVIKTTFLWMCISPEGEPENYLDPDCRFDSSHDLCIAVESGVLDNDFVPVNVSFIGKNHFIVQEKRRFISSYYYKELGESASRVKEKERKGRGRFEAEGFVKIVNCTPTPSRPLQGLWKGGCGTTAGSLWGVLVNASMMLTVVSFLLQGISEDMSLGFYLVSYDDNGGIITCRRFANTYSLVFWTSSTTFTEPPFSAEEEDLYESRIHLQPIPVDNQIFRSTPSMNEVISRILYINSSYDIVLPDLSGSSENPWHVKGRIWQNRNGTFGFGFLRNNFIIDMKHIALDGRLLDTAESCH